MKIKSKSSSSTIAVKITAPPCPTPPPPHQWQSILLPLIAGLLHARVFYHAAFGCILRGSGSGSGSNDGYGDDTNEGGTSSEEFRLTCFFLDSSILLAYSFDLICCLFFNVIPFSRCNCSRDIVGHHVPTLLLALPLAVPLWSGRASLRPFDEASFSILDDLPTNDRLRADFIGAYSMASGYAYVSSLNEVFMCLQRVEMSLAAVSSFRDVPSMGKRRFFTSRFGLGAELCYKLAFFWGMSLIACKACFDFDRAVYNHLISVVASSTSTTLLAVYSSPAVLRGALFRAFSVVMYPSMGMRCLKKIGQLRRGGNGEEERGGEKVIS
ncbi:hypothetical protein ACHAXA_010751 [Cyclostephanos tholiformis]|uniref:Uncharacterized protein n=1 Tax=Cyclostephanos tholiformis TaxID=382380 RepID=A0ABD3RS99_9STRA